ncbi:hypothetical protein KY290_010659 [Solanum tuberosum]|uniref:Uncharacterized protein n=1 Tax=Solanum tuberosum TaxID=4113 RepID=A0ABQ7W112_SOLTU|nr:hypothetical protein KY290_010659 [Solanum tuberosum]
MELGSGECMFVPVEDWYKTGLGEGNREVIIFVSEEAWGVGCEGNRGSCKVIGSPIELVDELGTFASCEENGNTFSSKMT